MSAFTAAQLGADHITADKLAGDAHPLLAELRSSAPVAHVAALDGWLVTSYALAREVLRDAETFTVADPRFTTARLLGPSMLSTDGAEHDRHRRPFSAAFRPGEVRARLTEHVQTETARLVADLRPHGTAEVRRELAGPLAASTMAAVLGLSGLDPALLASWYAGLVAAISELSAGRLVGPAGEAAWRELQAALAEAAAEQDMDGLGLTELVSNDAVLLFGGVDTTEAMITNALLHILDASECDAVAADPALTVDAIAADPALLADAVEESLRLEPAAARVDRYATREVVLGDATIRRGDLVMVSLSAANRDPAVFAEPDRFDPHRGNAREHLAFVVGPHFCLGAHLARLEVFTALQALLALPGLRLDRPARPEGLVFRKPTALHVSWDR